MTASVRNLILTAQHVSYLHTGCQHKLLHKLLQKASELFMSDAKAATRVWKAFIPLPKRPVFCQRQLGHSMVNTTQIYAKTLTESKLEQRKSLGADLSDLLSCPGVTDNAGKPERKR